LVTKRTRKRVFLDEMSLVVPWSELVGLIQPFAPAGTGTKGGRPTFALETMLRIHFLQQWFGLSDPAMEEAWPECPTRPPSCAFATCSKSTT
jgi:IS5 family transposase